ncbi:hypothetical protein M378DRAFT_164463 [Amanita muscaria Koide BX008]|uniref:Uncharacterized protein n=1 Tax=Amanita muscaria (strain Koide BX008) TaxID=946122 RepID=A0A0C2X3T9_AMAMK|nr:hypothetical protein M378DRAFT_164463 [Amanita muscaria Koide BX008]
MPLLHNKAIYKKSKVWSDHSKRGGRNSEDLAESSPQLPKKSSEVVGLDESVARSGEGWPDHHQHWRGSPDFRHFVDERIWTM